MQRMLKFWLVVLVLLCSAPASAEPKQGSTWVDSVTGMDFVWVPVGTFEMGCGSWSSECYDEEKPVHTVRVNGFWLGKFEVTQGQWKKVMGNNPSRLKRGDNYPVESVSWNDAKKFISKLNALSFAKFRLPTEAEWEYAARSGGKPEKFAGGNSMNDVDRVAWYEGNSGNGTHAVGTKAPNGLGLYDMSGNVWEWCEDVYSGSAYSFHQKDNPVYATNEKSARVTRGGAWRGGQRFVRTTSRNDAAPGSGNFIVGFRLARSN